MQKHGLKKIDKIISHFKDARILVVGDVMLDRFIWGTVSRISPEAPVPVVWTKSESFMPGGASNVANNICALGAKVHICGVIGDDEPGRTLVEELTRNGINSEGIIIDKTRPTASKTRIIAHHQQVVRIDKESDDVVNSKVIAKILSYAKNNIPDVDAVIIEDYGKGLIIPRLIKELISVAKRKKKIVLVDPKQEHFQLYKNVTIITPNRKEAETISGIKIKDKVSLIKAGRKVIQYLRSDAVLITLGEDGMALFRKNGKWTHIPTVAREVYDVSGAGDTVIAAFALAKSSGADMEEAAYISNIAAGIVVAKLGIAVCTDDELRSNFKQIAKRGIRPNKKLHSLDSIFVTK
ncbi:MAG: D-glycero-beta-D-manno-heptose-7-phosphate kinase [Candidatus Omnitrophota bacterium]